MNSSSYTDILSHLRKICIVKSFRQGMLAGHICRLLSPYCSAYFIKKNYTPNQVTMFMIVFGIIGSILFMLPNIWCKCIGYICWYLWFTMDLSDGEVARYTQIFSKYGVEMDYIAHLIDHPLMNIALWLTFLSQNIINSNLLALIFIVSISIELVNRNLIEFKHYCPPSHDKEEKHKELSWFKYFCAEAILYPNLIIVFSPVVIISWILDSPIGLYAYLIWLCYAVFMFIRFFCKTLKRFYIG